MLSVFGGNYLIIGELSVQWMPSALKIPNEEGVTKAVYPVWLMDSLGIRAAIFIRCPTCGTPLGLSPSDADEQANWNKEEPKLNSILGCGKCANLWMLTETKAYHLQVIPIPKDRTPRLLSMPVKGG